MRRVARSITPHELRTSAWSEISANACSDAAQREKRFFVSDIHHLAVAVATDFGKRIAWLDFDQLLTLHLQHRRQAIKKYVLANNNLAGVSDNAFTAQFNKALQKGSDNGTFLRPKGTSNQTIATTIHSCCDLTFDVPEVVRPRASLTSFKHCCPSTIRLHLADLAVANRYLRPGEARCHQDRRQASRKEDRQASCC